MIKNRESTIYERATMEFPAELEYLPEMLGFILEGAKSCGVDKASLKKLELASEEVIVNIISYAYPEKRGKVWIDYQKVNSSVAITIRDKGVAFNPLEHKVEGVDLPLEKRKVGGLGVFLLQKMITDLKYERVEEENRLTLIV